jgi:hypothetical protein
VDESFLECTELHSSCFGERVRVAERPSGAESVLSVGGMGFSTMKDMFAGIRYLHRWIDRVSTRFGILTILVLIVGFVAFAGGEQGCREWWRGRGGASRM